MRVEDQRRLPAVVVETAALALMAERFDGRRLTVARSIYLALLELAAGGIEVEATRAMVADYAGCTKKTLDEYAPLMEEAGLIKREVRVDGLGGNLPNLWLLLDTQRARGGTLPGRHADDPVQTSPPSSDLKDGGKTEGGGPRGSLLAAPGSPVAELIGEAMLADAEELRRRRTRVDGRVVTDAEMLKAAAALAEYNRQAGSETGLGAHLKPLVMRIRERPSYDGDALVRLVQSAWRIRWWERNGRGRRVTPAVIFGNAGCFENVVQDAIDEKKARAAGEAFELSPSRVGRYTRED